MSKSKVIVVLFCIILLGIMGYGIYGDGFGNVIEHGSSSDVPMSKDIDVNTSLPIQKDNHSTKLSVPTISTPVETKPKSSIVEADIYTAQLKETFKWLNGLEVDFDSIPEGPGISTDQLSKEELTLSNLKSIEELNLQFFKLSKTDLKYLKCLKNLKKLNLTHAKNIDFEVLSSLTSLKELNLSYSGFSDKDLIHLGFLPLEKIVLPTAVLTEDGVKTLSTYHLSTLYLYDEYQSPRKKTKKYKINVEKLKKALPNCKIQTLDYSTDVIRKEWPSFIRHSDLLSEIRKNEILNK